MVGVSILLSILSIPLIVPFAFNFCVGHSGVFHMKSNLSQPKTEDLLGNFIILHVSDLSKSSLVLQLLN